MSLIFQKSSDFDEWLKQYNYFEDGHILEIKQDRNNQNIELIISRYISSKYKPNAIKNFQVFQIIARNINYSSIWNSSDVNCDRYILPIQLDTNSTDIRFTIDIKTPVTINCTSLSIIKNPRRKKLIRPFIDSNYLAIDVFNASIPHPQKWIKWFAEHNINVSWRYHYSDAINIAKVPRENYGGWFIQETDLISRTSKGLFFSILNIKETGYYLVLERYDFTQRNWSCLQKILCNFDKFLISSGGSHSLTESEWRSMILEV